MSGQDDDRSDVTTGNAGTVAAGLAGGGLSLQSDWSRQRVVVEEGALPGDVIVSNGSSASGLGIVLRLLQSAGGSDSLVVIQLQSRPLTNIQALENSGNWLF